MKIGDVQRKLRRACSYAGSQKRVAEIAGVSPQYISDVLNGKREPGQAILTYLGLERVISYREVERK